VGPEAGAVNEAVLTTRLEGPAVEQEVAWDLIRRAVLVAPVLMAAGGLGWGVHGAASAGYAVALVVANFALSASLLAWAARVSLAVLMAAALGGYLVRLGLVTVAVLAVIHQPWVEVIPLAFTLVITHLGLLVWETRYVSATLAYPALKPRKGPRTRKAGR
jgi:hypothetical protein